MGPGLQLWKIDIRYVWRCSALQSSGCLLSVCLQSWIRLIWLYLLWKHAETSADFTTHPQRHYNSSLMFSLCINSGMKGLCTASMCVSASVSLCKLSGSVSSIPPAAIKAAARLTVIPHQKRIIDRTQTQRGYF